MLEQGREGEREGEREEREGRDRGERERERGDTKTSTKRHLGALKDAKDVKGTYSRMGINFMRSQICKCFSVLSPTSFFPAV